MYLVTWKIKRTLASMTEGMLVEGRNEARTCKYEPCGRELPPYAGRGRPQRYCRDRRWPGGKTCQQMAEAQRAAELAAGLDVPLAAFRTTKSEFVDAAETLGDRLDEVLDAVRAVDGGALTRIAEAEQTMVDAITRAQTAEAERDQAARDRQAARTDADARVEAAWRETAAAQRERGQAQAAEQAALQSLEQEGARRRDAEARALEATTHAKDLERQLAEARERVVAAERDVLAARAETDQVQQRLTDALHRADRAEKALTAARAETAEQARADAAIQTVQQAEQRVQAAEQRADRAERRGDELVAALAGRGTPALAD